MADDSDIWLDFKAANFQLTKEGIVVLVDYTPRLNKRYRTYFEDANGKKLSDRALLEEFLFHEVRKSSHFLAPDDPACNAAFGGKI